MSTKNSDLQPLPAGLTFCRKCENTKPTELFVLSTLSKSKQKGVCKPCWADYVKGRREARDLSKSISTADLSKDLLALHAFAGQIVAAVKELAHVSPDAANLAIGLEATHAALEANLACVRVDRLAKGLPPLPLPKASATKNEALPADSGASKIKNGLIWAEETEFQAVKPAHVRVDRHGKALPEIRTNVGSDGLSDQDRQSMQEDADAFYNSPEGKAFSIAEQDAEQEAAELAQRESFGAAQITAGPVYAAAELIKGGGKWENEAVPDEARKNMKDFAALLSENKDRKITQVVTDIQASSPECAEPVPLQDLPDNATEDDYARAQLLAEGRFEANAQTLPTPETEIPLGANKVVTDLDLTKDDF